MIRRDGRRGEALLIILARLHGAGVHREAVTISVGVGRHAPVNDGAMRKRVGEAIAASYRCFSPPVDDLSAYDTLGQTPEGVPVRVFHPVARADLRILVGSVLPHLQAGFGGGYKLIFPGTSHRTTLSGLHRQGISGKSDPASLLGGLAAGNAMRQSIHAAARLLGRLSVSHLAGGHGQVFRIVAEIRTGSECLGGRSGPVAGAPAAMLADLVVAGSPWPGDPMQSFKVLLHHRGCRRRRRCWPGCSGLIPDEIDRSFPLVDIPNCGNRKVGRVDHPAVSAFNARRGPSCRSAGGIHDALGVQSWRSSGPYSCMPRLFLPALGRNWGRRSFLPTKPSCGGLPGTLLRLPTYRSGGGGADAHVEGFPTGRTDLCRELSAGQSVNFTRGSLGRSATAARGPRGGAIAGMPAFGGGVPRQDLFSESVPPADGVACSRTTVIDVGDAFQGCGGRELSRALGTVLEKILFPEGSTPQDAGSTRFHRHLDLLKVIGVIDGRGKEDPGPLARGVQGLKVFAKLLV